jgi:hypothetical protein
MSEEPGSPISDWIGYTTINDSFLSGDEVNDAAEEARWREHKAILRRAAEELAHRRAKAKAAALVGTDDSFQELADSLEYASIEPSSSAVRDLFERDPDRAASLLNLALRESSPERRRKIGAALAVSGLIDEAIEDLSTKDQASSYSAFSLLFLVAKAGEVQPLIQIIESHPNVELRLAVIRLLAASGESNVLSALQGLPLETFPPVVASAVQDVIYQLTHQP